MLKNPPMTESCEAMNRNRLMSGIAKGGSV